MSLSLSRRSLLATAIALPTLARAQSPALELVATFTGPRQVTGVAVSPKGRVFVNFPRWEEDVAISVGEVGPGGALKMGADRTFTVAIQDPRLLWPDSMAQGPDGTLYVTASHIPEMKAWQGPGVSRSELFRFRPA